jgi:hypothetical protein
MSFAVGPLPVRCAPSPGRHGRQHAHVIGQAYQPPDVWRWCCFDQTYV